MSDTSRLEVFVCTGDWFWINQKSFDDARGRVSLITDTGERYVFDIRTGQPVNRSVVVHPRINLTDPLAFVLSGSVIAALFLTRRIARNRHAR